MSREFTYDFNRMTENAIGPGGISDRVIDDYAKRAPDLMSRLDHDRKNGKYGFYDLPHETGMLHRIQAFAESRRAMFANFVQLGIGGSALGNIMLHSALDHPYHNLVRRPRIAVVDNIDPVLLSGMMDAFKPAETMYCVVTKSGSTTETMSAFLLIRKALEDAVGSKWNEHMVFITDEKNGTLRELADSENVESFVIPDNVGGRFSVLCPVGLLSAAFSGIDLDALLQGARDMDQFSTGDDPRQNPALMAAVLHHWFATQKSKNIDVLMPYSSSLKNLADWYRQLWAESLGKSVDRDGNTIHTGQTPVLALGTTDQHSQVQLYREGPDDKIYTFIEVAEHARKVVLPDMYSEKPSTGYLGGKEAGAILNYALKATQVALSDVKRPLATIRIGEADAYHMGMLIFFFEVMTAISGELYNINAFDQPGVEGGKKALYALMGREGYEKEAERIRSASSDDPDKVISLSLV